MVDNHVMVITGTRKGIGRHLAHYYATRGFQVMGCSRKNVDFQLENYLDIGCGDCTKTLAVGKKLGLDTKNIYGHHTVGQKPYISI